ncbi:hypothetical protein BR63_11270 [Thermanaerosceptrum fracticalcis]|uniref:IstB-like ATP-binding domain-containing protein n=1 Tax=Thermanaerosceptrum fracticalcis TaxID=1712410 RepID=A0A7G6E434_THEFR|nr:ATP-binding protein [Thermanaerosceptrum fracticalcis]QNB46838.1 hypothetical protein BR63_11270 [Thermanaerosceptrum fracticalcis]
MFEAEMARMVMQYCDVCLSLGDCPLPMKGWQPVAPSEEAKKMYGEAAPWSYRKCRQQVKAEMEKQQAAAMAGKWQERTLDSYKVHAGNKQAYEVCVEYAKRLNPFVKDGILLYGSVGTGKTHLAVGILKTAFHRGLTGVLVKVPDLLEEIRRGYNGEYSPLEGKVRNIFLVILDDLGAEKVTDWVREKLYSIIDHRYENEKPLIITTNCPPSELTERIGVRTADRLREMCKIVEVQGKSYRAVC